MLFRVEGERVDVDTILRSVSVAFPRLDEVEVVAVTGLESIVTIELQAGFNDWVTFALQTETEVERLDNEDIVGVTSVVGVETLINEAVGVDRD